MINVLRNVSMKSFYRFVEFTSKLCGSSLTHEKYKQITLDIVDAQSKEEIDVKHLSNSFLYVINNSRQTLSKEIINNIYYLLTNTFLDELLVSKILKKYYTNLNSDLFTKIVHIHNLVTSQEICRKIEFALLLANYIMLKEDRGVLVPFAVVFNEFISYTSLGDSAQLILLFKQMEDRHYEDNNSIKMTYDDVINIIKPVLFFIKNSFKVSTLCLYGSIVKGIMNESSDIDFLVDFDNNLLDFEKGNYREKLTKYLNELLKAKIDLIYFDHAVSKLDISEMNNIIVLIKPEDKRND